MSTNIAAEHIACPDYRYEEVRIENTNHCGYKCFFCPREEMTRAKGYMSLDDFDHVLERIGHHDGRVDLHGFGEPLLDTMLPEKLRRLTHRWPRSSPRLITTLGLSVSADFMHQLILSGLATLEVSLYGVDRESYKAAHGVDKFELVMRNLETLTGLIDRTGASTEVVVREFPRHEEVKQPGLIASARQKMDEWLFQIGVKRISQHVVHNYGGGRNYNAPPEEGVCSVVWGFRKRVLQITWDLDVIPCCFDSNSTVKLGSLRDSTLAEIYSSDAYTHFIAAHEDNKLEPYPVCQKCERCFKS